ncbi:MAG: RNA-guided endonuclease IscB [Phototrophicales bacterium]|nr:RNA-guided endonuclease IscB [Phototrophicales bacterium]
MQRVFVLDKNKEPLMPCNPARARQLLKSGKATVYHRYPFTIILKDREGGNTQPIQIKIDPGSQTTGIAVVVEFKRGLCCVWAGELTHRGQQIRDGLLSRRQLRRGRRTRKLRYRKARFDNRNRPDGWLAPSLMSRVYTIETWVKRLMRYVPVTHLAMELVKFDTQAMVNPEISGVDYQQGELWGYEVREYLLEKFGRKCVYCGIKDVPLEIEHIVPKSRGGSNRVSNLTLACHPCNQQKGNQTADEFGHPNVQRLAKAPLKDASAVNATRWKLYETLQGFRLPIEIGTGGRTKYNRAVQNYPKTHWLDAMCVGESGQVVFVSLNHQPLVIKAVGRGNRQMTKPDKYGFPRATRQRKKVYFGFQTGDMAKARVTSGKKEGIYVGKVAVRASGSFNITTTTDTIQGINHRFFKTIHKSDGYNYMKGEQALLPMPKGRGFPRLKFR